MYKSLFHSVADPAVDVRGGGHMASANREPITEVWGLAPARVQGAEPPLRARRASPPLIKLKAF